ncbi:MAG: glycosyltransferase family 1 protein [Bdellovibrionales bacterium]|nr:glycosyltransferase family 1 protein [Bdellovibrionales bacterium]
MKKVLILTLPVPGHMNPGIRIADQLARLGHQVFFASLRDTLPFIKRSGVSVSPLVFGERTFPKGALAARHSGSTKKGGAKAFFSSVQFMRSFNDEILSDLLSQSRDLKIDLLVADELVVTAARFAELLGVSHCSFAAALSVLPDRRGICPPPSSKSLPSRSLTARIRNRVSAKALDFWASTTSKSVAESIDSGFSKKLHLSLCPQAFDFDRGSLPKNYVYVSPPHSVQGAAQVSGNRSMRPVLYAAFGTLIHFQERRRVLALISQLGAQLGFEVHVGLGSWAAEGQAQDFSDFHPDAKVYEMAPQLELIQKADWVVTHGGMNTVMEALSMGKPVLVLPYNQDQFGIAARVRHHGLGKSLDFKDADAQRLSRILSELASDGRYKERAFNFQKNFQNIRQAGDLIHERFLA